MASSVAGYGQGSFGRSSVTGTSGPVSCPLETRALTTEPRRASAASVALRTLSELSTRPMSLGQQ